MSVGNLSSFFQMPEFRAGQSGFNFSGSPLGTPSFIGSVPTYADNASSVTPLQTSNTGMAFPLAAVASIGTSIAGLFGQQSAADKQAKAVEEAAREQSQAVKQASKIGAQLQLAEFGLNYLRDRDAFGAGGAGDRFNEALNISQRANIEANNPSLAALRSIARYEDRLSRAMPGYTPPSALFS